MDDAEASADIQPILAELRWRTGVDFARYRASTVRRRIHNRMISVGARNTSEYLALLQASSEEATHLLDRIAIKVSRFYRHPPAWKAVAEVALAELATVRRPLSAWSAGCGNGEEVYTLAMLLADAGLAGTVLGTDIDPGAIAVAQAGRYARQSIADLPAHLAATCLHVPAGDGDDIAVTDAIRARTAFARHDLIFAAAPGHGFDIVCCRNLLIYLRRDARAEAFATLAGAIRLGGFLLLGESECPPESLAAVLEPVSHAGRLFRKVATS